MFTFLTQLMKPSLYNHSLKKKTELCEALERENRDKEESNKNVEEFKKLTSENESLLIWKNNLLKKLEEMKREKQKQFIIMTSQQIQQQQQHQQQHQQSRGRSDGSAGGVAGGGGSGSNKPPTTPPSAS